MQILNVLDYKDLILTFIGIIGGFILSELTSYYKEHKRRKRLKVYFSKYEGTYSVTRKDNTKTPILSIKISYHRNNLLKVHFFIENENDAEGNLIMDESTLMYGTLFYHHIKPEYRNLSGFYDVMFIDENEIHARQSYISSKTGGEVLGHFIKKK